VPDLEAFSTQTGHQILASERRGETYRFLVRRVK
jgi:TusA-related sulfurtransferase